MSGHKRDVIEMEWIATCWAVPFVVDYRTTAGANVWLRRPSWQTALFYVLLWTGSDGKFREPASRYEQVVGDQRERRDVVQVSDASTAVHLPSSAFQFRQLDWTVAQLAAISLPLFPPLCRRIRPDCRRFCRRTARCCVCRLHRRRLLLLCRCYYWHWIGRRR